MEEVGIFYGHLVYCTARRYTYVCGGHLVYFMVIWNISWSFGIFYGHLVYFSRFGMLHQEKSDNPGVERCAHIFGISISVSHKHVE
jgi:hypothetical protein